MEIRQSLTFEGRQQQKLGHKHRLQLKNLLQQLDQLKDHSDIPNPKKGLEGMEVADEILKTRNAAGVLIGSLAETVWGQRRKPEELLKHKDVDVAVITPEFKLEEPFEAGIDWWMPQDERMDYVDQWANIQRNAHFQWWENANGVILQFKLKLYCGDLVPGLHILPPENLVEMRMIEALASVERGVVECDYEAEDALRDKLEKRIKTKLPKFLRERFTGQIADDTDENGYGRMLPVTVEQHNNGLADLVAINSYIQRGRIKGIYR